MIGNTARLLPLLQCPACQSASLERTERPYPGSTPFELAESHLQCTNCGTDYPITADDIPVLWTDALKTQMLSAPDPDSNIGANLQIYNAISDNYQRYTRQLPQNARRIQDGAARILSQSTANQPRFHLDFGCGPGQVLGWLKEYQIISVGLDVSLVNLRNARDYADALVVCGDATRMPFKDQTFSLVTEASVLHHIQDWQSVVQEACRVCHPQGGILLDAEPSQEMVAFSQLAIFVFNLRVPVYKLLSFVRRDKYIFRDIEQAKLNLKAEIHHQPGTGFPLDKMQSLFRQAGFNLHLYHSPAGDLDTLRLPKLQNVILNLLSLRNPWDPKLGAFTAIGTQSARKPAKG
jgi:ubiquinone/menaquinone biosynthesis C-methylase UbiE/uncharacterized protein YbaR (Trm112 family)